MTLREAIIKKVTEIQGCKVTQLVVEVAEYLDDETEGSFQDVVAKLIEEKEIIEIEYILPAMSYRIKSFLLPKGSEIL